MAKNQSNLRIGDAEIYITNGVDPEFCIGHTKGGIEFSFERDFEDLTHDQGGDTPVDKALKGNNLKIKAMVAEATTYNLQIAIPEGKYNDGSVSESLGMGTDSGYLLSNDDVQLRLHPRNRAASDYTEDIYVWRAVSTEAVELGYKIDEQRILEITFEALYDQTQPDGQRLGRVGPLAIS